MEIEWRTGTLFVGNGPIYSSSLPIKYTVEGGVYTDTSFTEIVPGTEERYGLFDTYDEALSVWRSKVGWMVDICEHRLSICAYAVTSGDFNETD